MNANLTPQELRVLTLICEDAGLKQIADSMGINIKTVDKHRDSLYAKIGVSTRLAAVRWALRHSVVDLNTWLASGEYHPRPTLLQRQAMEHRVAPTLS